MIKQKCKNKNCDSNLFITSSQNEFICLQCSFIQENHNLVSDIHFENNQLTGKVVRHERTMPSFMTMTEQTHQRAQKLLYQIAHNMNIPSFDADPALQAYMIAQHRNFIKGRHSAHVAAACLYIVSRERNKPHLLIDFADALHINLYTLGACFLKLVRFLHRDLPLIDPSVFIRRFCSALEFGERQLEVELTANRLLKRMRVDWLEQGRRPGSLCGAAILISARFHGFKRTTQQMVNVVNVCDETLRKRLEEFKQTSVAKLTKEVFKQFKQFDMLDQGILLEEEQYPPSFKKSIKNKEILNLTDFQDQLQHKVEKIEKQLNTIESQSQSSKSRRSSIQMDQSLVIYEPENADFEYKHNHEVLDSESLSDMEEEEKNHYILSNEESRIKNLLWINMNKDWLKEQESKQPKKPNQYNYIRKKVQQKNQLINAPDAISALINESKISKRLNQNILQSLFDDQEPNIIKKIQLDSL